MSLFLILAPGCSPQPQPAVKPLLDAGHHLGTKGSSVFAFGYNSTPNHSVVFYFPYDINSGSEHTSNTETTEFAYSGTITTSPSKSTVLTYQIASSDPASITCNGADYDLEHGTVFYVTKDGAVHQLPFVGLLPTKEYAARLHSFFAESTIDFEGSVE